MIPAGRNVFFGVTFNSDGVFDGSIAAAPESETYAMMLVGLGLVGWQLRRRSLRAAAYRYT